MNLWLLLDDRAGNRSQCLGVAEALGISATHKTLAYSRWAKLPNWLLGASFVGLASSCKSQLLPPWPDLLLSAGRRTAPVARRIKKLSGGRTQLVQIMWPGGHAIEDFDLVCVPSHDVVPELPNVFRMTGAPACTSPTGTVPAGRDLATLLETLPSPKIALLCGGSTKNRRFTDAMARELGRAATAMARGGGGSLLVTTSRRTGTASAALEQAIADVPSHVHRWDDTGENPYRTYLSQADAFIVTGESISMCSEACSTGKPVYVFAPAELITEKHGRFHQELYRLGCARPLGEAYRDWTYEPLDAARQVARQIRRQFSLGTEPMAL